MKPNSSSVRRTLRDMINVNSKSKIITEIYYKDKENDKDEFLEKMKEKQNKHQGIRRGFYQRVVNEFPIFEQKEYMNKILKLEELMEYGKMEIKKLILNEKMENISINEREIKIGNVYIKFD